MENIARLFDMEVREKKKAANGVHGKTGLRGYVGKILTPVDFMGRKEKRKYKGASKVTTYSYNEILPLDKLKELAKDTQKELIEAWRQKFSVKQIKEVLGLNDYNFYKFLDQLGIERQMGGGGIGGQSRAKKTREKKEQAAIKTAAPAQLAAFSPPPEEAQQQIDIIQPPRRPLYNGLRLEYHGEYETPEAINRLMKIASLLEGEEKKYRITILLEEKS